MNRFMNIKTVGVLKTQNKWRNENILFHYSRAKVCWSIKTKRKCYSESWAHNRRRNAPSKLDHTYFSKHSTQQHINPLMANFELLLHSYLIENDVCYLVMCDKMYSKRNAFTYLEDLAQEFHKNYGRKVNTVTRPYAFIEFDVYIQKTKKNLTDRRKNINSINTQLQDVQRIMVNVNSLIEQLILVSKCRLIFV